MVFPSSPETWSYSRQARRPEQESVKRNHTQVKLEITKKIEVSSFPALGLLHGGVEHFAKARALYWAQGSEFSGGTENHHNANKVQRLITGTDLEGIYVCVTKPMPKFLT